jgi:PIN domain nuclease of toxin-antitoxin system
MRFLLDTHTYLWFRTAPRRLPTRALDLLTDTSHEGLISIVVPWEIAIKTKTGKLDGAALLAGFEARETAAGFVFLQPTSTQAVLSGLLPPHHRDPFDRLLIAQALELGISIVGNDTLFDLYSVQRIWD